MILPFKPQFVPKILDGTKIHTIRTDETDRWKANRLIHFATNVRTKAYKQFNENTCKSTQAIIIIWKNKDVEVLIDDKFFYTSSFFSNLDLSFDSIEEQKMLQLANNDGFDTIEEFFNWFSEDYKGKIIHWTDFRY